MNDFLLRHADPLVLGDLRRAGDIGTFDPFLARAPARSPLAPNNRNPRGDGGGPRRRRRRAPDRFHVGVRGRFSNMGLLAIGAAAVAAVVLLKK